MMVDFRAMVLRNSGFDSWEDYTNNEKKKLLAENKVIEEIEIDGWRAGIHEMVPCWVCDLHGKKLLKIAKGHVSLDGDEWSIDYLKKYWRDGSSYFACAGNPGSYSELLLDMNQVKAVIARY